MSQERRLPLCRNAGNPFHGCSDYCFKVIAEAKKRSSEEEAAFHKLGVVPGMLDRQQMLTFLSKRAVDSPKGRVTKRNKDQAGDSDAAAIEVKKPKSLFSMWKQATLGLLNSKEVVVKQGEKSVNSIPANVPLEENKRSQGEAPIGVGAGAPVKRTTAPPGEEKWLTPTTQTCKGCLGDVPYPLDNLKAFQMQTDLSRYAKMEDWEFEEHLRVQVGSLMSSLDTLKTFQIHMDPDRYAKMEDWKFEEQLRVQAGALMSSLAAMKVRQNAAKKHEDLLNAEVEELKETVELSKKELSTARSELEQKRNDLISSEAKRVQLETEVKLLNTQMSDYSAKICRVFKLERQLSEAPSYKDHVERFLKTEAFKTIVNNYSATSFKMGYEAYTSMIREGQAFDSSKHGWDAYLALEMEKMASAEPSEARDAEPEDDETALYQSSENDTELQEEKYEANEWVQVGGLI